MADETRRSAGEYELLNEHERRRRARGERMRRWRKARRVRADDAEYAVQAALPRRFAS